MKFSLNWLRELCDVDATPQEIAQKLTFAGFEVEGVTDLRRQWQHVIVVEVAEVQPHPQADKLKLVKVLDGEGTRTIVCGAPDVKVGTRVALAEPGAVLGGKTIGVTEIRGVESAGMLCSERELGLSDDHAGLCELPADWALGKKLGDTPLGDVLLEISITPNRPDAMCHLGIAREMAAVFGTRVKKPRILLREDAGDVGERVGVEIVDSNGCKRYIGRAVTGVKTGPSPLTVRARLFLLGTRAISNVVDATNWVMLEVGHPLHAFDLGRLNSSGKQKRVFVRRAQPGEALKTLDGVDRKLDEEDLVIADQTRVLALAGIMGGNDSGVVDGTSDVMIESAWFEPAVVFKTAKKLGMQTEASNRFWRGTDIEGLQFANERCCQLLSEWAGGKVCRGAIDVYPRRRTMPEVSLRPKRLNDYLGIAITAEDVAKYLTSLELTVKGRTEQAITFGIPPFRIDLTTEVDLIEEVARRHGYHQIPERLPEAGGPYTSNLSTVPDYRRLRDLIASQGVSEAINYSFVGRREEETFRPADVTGALPLANPMTETESVMRSSLLPGLLKNAKHNGDRNVDDVRLFEIGRVFKPRDEASRQQVGPRDAVLPIEEDRFAVLLSGPAAPFGWGTPTREVDFFDVKRTAEAVFDAWRVTATYHPDGVPSFLHPHASARLTVERDGQEVPLGVIGQVHPRALEAVGMSGQFFVLDVTLSLFGGEAPVAQYRALPRFPGIRRDIALIAADGVRSGSIVDRALKLAPEKAPTLESVRLFDVYAGKPVPSGHVSLALAFFFRAPERTLTDDEVQAQFSALIEQLSAEFALQVRES